MLVTLQDIEARTGTPYVEAADIAKVSAAIEDVTALIESHCRRQFADPVPSAVKALAAREVIAALNTDPGVSAERVGDLATTYAGGGSVAALSPSTREALYPFRRSGVGSIRLLGPCAPVPAPDESGVTP